MKPRLGRSGMLNQVTRSPHDVGNAVDAPGVVGEELALHVTPERLKMTKAQLLDALEAQRREIFSYLESLGEADLGRKAKIPLFKQFMGTDEIALPVYIGAMFDYHWNDHAGQIGKIRKANGMPAA